MGWMRVNATIGVFTVLFAETPGAQVPQLERVRTIGCSACEGPASFHDIAGIWLEADGRVIVLDHGEPHVRIFDANGGTLASFGRSGSGPGEFRAPSFLIPQPGGAIAVFDVTNRRVTTLGAGGNELASSPLREFPIAVAAGGPEGPIVVATTDFKSPTLAIDLLGARHEPDRLFRFTTDFPRRAENEPSTFVALAASSAGTFAVGDGAVDYRIRVYGSSGALRQEIARSIDRTRRTGAEIATEQARRDRMRSRILAMRQTESRSAPPLEPPPIPELKAHFLANALVFDQTGRLWVRTERGGLGDTIFDLFDPTGRFMGEIRVAARIGRYVIAHGILAGITIDADDAQYVTLFRLVD